MHLLKSIDEVVLQALNEDIGEGDLTASLIPEKSMSKTRVITREKAVICGTCWFDSVFKQLDENVKVTWLVKDGDLVEPNQELVRLKGPTRPILTGERTALNFLQTLSGTATAAYNYAQVLEGTTTKLLDTRKTVPGTPRSTEICDQNRRWPKPQTRTIRWNLTKRKPHRRGRINHQCRQRSENKIPRNPGGSRSRKHGSTKRSDRSRIRHHHARQFHQRANERSGEDHKRSITTGSLWWLR